MKKIFVFLSVATLIFLTVGCQSIPEGATAVSPFNAEKYLGKWYEIARIDFKFEKNLNNTTAEYSKMDNGLIKVLNQGYNYKKNNWQKAEGKARFRGAENIAELEVSFFGPFYTGYNIIGIEGDYSDCKYALVAGQNTDFLWILSREKTIPNDIKEKFLTIAKGVGYDTSRLIWVEHDDTPRK